MKMNWQLQEAKNRFSEVINNALEKGVQVISRRGEEIAVVISIQEYKRLQKSQGKLSEFFRVSPLRGIDLTRDQSLPRREDLE